MPCRSLLRALLVVSLLLVAGLGPTAPAQAANSGFVSASGGGQFVLNGQPFYFASSNAYYLVPAATWGETTFTDETMTMAHDLGFTVFRIWGFFDDPAQPTALQPAAGVYNEASFRAMDYVLYKADQAGVRLLISLVNYWPDFGGMPQYVRWCAPGSSTDAFYSNTNCKQLYKNYVSHLLNRVNTYNGRQYRNDPTVFAWELANEPRSGDHTGQLVRGWVAEMAAYIKSVDANHMVTTGEEGFDTTSAGYTTSAYNGQTWLFNGSEGVSFSLNTADPHIDFGQIHMYPSYWSFSTAAGSTWIADHIKLARVLGKPLVLGEFGYTTNQATVYDAWLRTVDTENGAGALVWELMCSSCYRMRGQFDVQYPPSSAVSDVLKQAAARAAAKSGPSTPPPPLSPSFTIGTVGVNPGTAGPGQSVAITVPVTSATAMSGILIDVEVYDTAGTKVGQKAFSGQTFSAGQTLTYSYAWPGSTSTGTFKAKVGVFTNDWSTAYLWNDGAATIAVSNGFTIGTVTVNPGTASPGQGVAISVPVTSTKTVPSFLTDVSVYDSAGTKIANGATGGLTISAGQTITYTWTWPGSSSLGTYTVKAAVLSDDSSTVYASNNAAGAITVASNNGSGGTGPFVVTSTSISPASVARGSTVKITTSVRSSQRTSAIVDIEIYDAAGTWVAQSWCTLSFKSGQTRACSWSYVVPSSLAPGVYTVKAGVFSKDWSVLYLWVNQAGTFIVQ